MIRALLAVASPDAGRLVRWNLAGLIAEGVLTGIAFALLVPVLTLVIGVIIAFIVSSILFALFSINELAR